MFLFCLNVKLKAYLKSFNSCFVLLSSLLFSAASAFAACCKLRVIGPPILSLDFTENLSAFFLLATADLLDKTALLFLCILTCNFRVALLEIPEELFLATTLVFFPSTWVILDTLTGLEFLNDEDEFGFLDRMEGTNFAFCFDLKDAEGSWIWAGPEVRALVLPKWGCMPCILISASAVRLRWLLPFSLLAGNEELALFFDEFFLEDGEMGFLGQL